VILFSNRFDWAELQPRFPASLFGRPTSPNVLLSLHCEMLFHLFTQSLIATFTCGEISDADQKPKQCSHVKSSALTSKNRATIAALCSQSRFSVEPLAKFRI
jgi:hypothetical protein